MDSHNARLGARLFLVYLLFYGAFVLVNAVAPGLMEATPLGGLNLALLSGFGLLLLALVLALVYGVAAKRGDDGEAAASEIADASNSLDSEDV